ncbi:hypothetical protein CYPRO_1269 [Cyclonatronum proteinivorum]|uniref:DUF3618 domain-containing protein n=1 Tax=Cyclonatronum proteinivorum TaxID=1457365 RepID=A0A345UJ74_9BACT|nr:hypothetical protein [Cyclonatronum proteinivorum]AXJ00526.1 hypothetical protein CYPRO_1269 [Cyclonatronum proteinivorum]
MADKSAKEIQDKKKALEAELKALENRLGSSFEQIKDEVEGKVERTRNSVSPAWWVRKHPGYVLVAAAVLGFIVAPRSRKRLRNRDDSHARKNSDAGGGAAPERAPVYSPGITDIVSGEVKRLLMRKATNFLVEKIDELIDKNIGPRKKDQNE